MINFDPYFTIEEIAENEINEKKSRFFGIAGPVSSEQEAENFLAEIRKKHRDAGHHCSAFIIGRNSELVRCRDDGEPGGTAGKPILEVLRGAGLVNVIAVVTRYFGGILLGTGGLVRAYTQATQAVLAKAAVVEMVYGNKITIVTDYSDIAKIQHLLEKRKIAILQARYFEKAEFDITIPREDTEMVSKAITEVVHARAVITVTSSAYYRNSE